MKTAFIVTLFMLLVQASFAFQLNMNSVHKVRAKVLERQAKKQELLRQRMDTTKSLLRGRGMQDEGYTGDYGIPEQCQDEYQACAQDEGCVALFEDSTAGSNDKFNALVACFVDDVNTMLSDCFDDFTGVTTLFQCFTEVSLGGSLEEAIIENGPNSEPSSDTEAASAASGALNAALLPVSTALNAVMDEEGTVTDPEGLADIDGAALIDLGDQAAAEATCNAIFQAEGAEIMQCITFVDFGGFGDFAQAAAADTLPADCDDLFGESAPFDGYDSYAGESGAASDGGVADVMDAALDEIIAQCTAAGVEVNDQIPDNVGAASTQVVSLFTLFVAAAYAIFNL